MKKKSVALTTLGCKVNQYESDAIESLFKNRGYIIKSFNDAADIYIINTCTVTHIGDRKSRQLIRRATKRNPDALVVVTGCYAQVSPEEVKEVSGVNLVVGTAEKARIVDLVENALSENTSTIYDIDTNVSGSTAFDLPPALEQNRVRAYLKIQEGCDNYCTYCIVPYARGSLRSRSMEDILKEASKLLNNSFKEIVLTGIHTGAYGKDIHGDTNLASLVREISLLKGLARLRISSLEPQDVDDKLIDIMSSSPVLCRHLHLPLQSGDDQVLERMKRRYDTRYYRNLVQSIRSKIPGIAITTDIIVGFPGETDAFFDNSLRFVHEMDFADLHVFKYSPRRGTAAASFKGQVEPSIKEYRSKQLIELGNKLRHNYLLKNIGKKNTVLVEQPWKKNNHLYEGLTDNYINMVFPAKPEMRGSLLEVIGERVGDGFMHGRIISA